MNYQKIYWVPLNKKSKSVTERQTSQKKLLLARWAENKISGIPLTFKQRKVKSIYHNPIPLKRKKKQQSNWTKSEWVNYIQIELKLLHAKENDSSNRKAMLQKKPTKNK